MMKSTAGFERALCFAKHFTVAFLIWVLTFKTLTTDDLLDPPSHDVLGWAVRKQITYVQYHVIDHLDLTSILGLFYQNPKHFKKHFVFFVSLQYTGSPNYLENVRWLILMFSCLYICESDTCLFLLLCLYICLYVYLSMYLPTLTFLIILPSISIPLSSHESSGGWSFAAVVHFMILWSPCSLISILGVPVIRWKRK